MSAPVIEGFRLSPGQQRVWRSQQRAGSVRLCRAAIEILGPLDSSALKTAIGAVVDSHEILRTSFRSIAGLELPLQVIVERPELTNTWQKQTLQLQC